MTSRTAGEDQQLRSIEDKLSRLTDNLAQITQSANRPTADWFELLAGVKSILGNFNNDMSFVSTLLAKEWLVLHFGTFEFDACDKPQGAPGLDIDIRTPDGERLVAEIKTTSPYAPNDFGAQQRASLLRDFEKLRKADARHKIMFVTDDRAFERLQRPPYKTADSGILLVHLLSTESVSNASAAIEAPASVAENPALGGDPEADQRSLGARITDLVRRRPGLTERELAEEIFGPDGYQQRVNQECRLLVEMGLIERRGKGGVGDPFVYHPHLATRGTPKT